MNRGGGYSAALVSIARGRRARLLAGLALPFVISGLAQARTLNDMAPPPAAIDKAPAHRPDDGLRGGGFYLEADTLVDNDTTHHVIAQGSVEVRYKGRVLRADRVDYDRTRGVVTATGRVQLVQPDGAAQFADSLSLDRSMSDGFASGFSTRLQGHVQIAARTTRRRSAGVTEFDHVVYTPCLTCAENGHHPPTWSIRARSVVENKARHSLVFRDAVVQVLGQGVLYIPLLQAADPTAERKSGFLLPLLTFSGPRGVSYEQPYYQVISPYQDILITPQINSNVNPFLNIDWRKRFYSGIVEVRGGYTYEKDFNESGQKFGTATSRSYVLANGNFMLSPKWSWGFTAERASDKLIFDKYSVTDAFSSSQNIDRGLYAADDRRLISQIYAVRQDSLSYLSIAAINVQGLRPTDRQSTFPTVAPLIEGRWEAPWAILGGRLRIDGSAVVLTRDQTLAATDAAGQTVLPGVDSRRATLQGDWERTFRLSNGLMVQPFIDGRADLYDISNVQSGTDHATLTRGFGVIGANVSYPLIRSTHGVTYILEPIGQVAIAPNVRQDPRIPNEDSVDFEFDETNLFKLDRSPGFDLYEGGQSFTLAGRATAILDDGRSASLMIGRRLAMRSDLAVPDRTGLQSALSDWILGADATPVQGVRLFSRLRLDSHNLAVNRLEAGAAFTSSRAEGYLSYLEESQSPFGGALHSLDIHGAFFPLPHWGVTTYAIVDGGAWRRRDLGLVYRDDCIRVEVLYRHDETFNGTLGPSTSVVLRLTLATLGNTR